VDAVSVTAPRGFTAAGVAAGIKGDGALDLALVAAGGPAVGAGVFTTNRAAAAPVRLSREHLAFDPVVRAVVLNSGCANAATGFEGAAVASMMAGEVARLLECGVEDVLVCSTGPIGTQLSADAVSSGISAAAGALDPDAGHRAATAILTTDTVTKEVVVQGDGYTVGGMAKGAGMVRPDMATMLSVLTTDAVVTPEHLDEALRIAVDRSFHSLNIDGCPSTNDSVIAVASHASGVRPEPVDLAAALTAAAESLAAQLAADAEGASRVVTLSLSGATDDAAARFLGRALADSVLVRASFFGGDPNWGRIVGAIGAAGVPVDVNLVSVGYGGVPVAERGVGLAVDEDAVASLLHGDFEVQIGVGDGPGRARILTTDLTPDYVQFNGGRS
jgi:glutamate N-acetyltransferase/amino-acid N-acetyltransferase